MLSEDFHPRDGDLLMTADGELSARRAARVRAHLASCWDCCARMAELEGTIANFARVHRQLFGPQLPPIAGARAHLKARLAELVIRPRLTRGHVSPYRYGIQAQRYGLVYLSMMV
jgi:anti-sigma factor RsiW